MSMTLEQAKKNRINAQGTRDHAQGLVNMCDDEIALREKEQAAQPKLRHGDYFNAFDEPAILVGNRVLWLNPAHADDPFDWLDISQLSEKMRCGNLLDDLRSLAEDRTEWIADNLKLKVDFTAREFPIRIQCGNDVRWMTLDEAKNLSLALRQIIATAERKAK